MTFERVPAKPEYKDGEESVLAFWRESKSFDKLREKVRGKPRWSFLDGPITANGPMGVHHAWGRTYKDAFQRYFAMTGHDQRFQNGFDCQGLWVEVEVEKELGFKSKTDIEAYGLEKFINACKDRVVKFSGIQTDQSIRLGMWMDWDNSYFTMSDENNYTIWSMLKKCHERGLIYKGLDSMPWCPRCGTGISEQERREGYKSIEDEAVYVRFPLRGRAGEYLLIWTTTPWTLAANVAAAVSPDLTYVKARGAGDDHIYYLAKGVLSMLGEGAEVLEELQGSKMVGWTYDGPFDDLPGAAPAVSVHQVIEWDEVSENEGSGVVHIAPGCGKEDFDLGKKLGLPVIVAIDDAGIYGEGFGLLTGKFAGEVGQDVYTDLQRKGLFVRSEKYVHDYPHCWRCNTKLLFRAVDEWFIDMSWRGEIKSLVPQIRWVPEYGESQEQDWLNNMGDWMISKKRYWGLALPIWECSSCGNFEVIGGKEELQERAIQGWDSFVGNSPHRPWVDAVKIRCSNCGKTASRIPDVGNPWLDAGIVPYSTVQYNSNREHWAKWIPADFVVESFPGQFRNWFYSLLAMSTMMEGIPPFKTLLGYALVRDEHGEEMHKSKGNAIDFHDAVQNTSADSMRWLFCRHTPTINLHFGFTACHDIERKVFGTLWNTYAFLVQYARLDGFDPSRAPQVPISERPEIDRWILSQLHKLTKEAHDAFQNYWITPLVKRAEEFLDDLSNWYVRRNRRRFWRTKGDDDRDKTAAYQTLYELLLTFVKLMAPIIPFITERLYQNLRQETDPESVHLCDFPQVDESAIDENLSKDMGLVREITKVSLSLRSGAGIRVRQPLAELRLMTRDQGQRKGIERLVSGLIDELNVKKVGFGEEDNLEEGWLQSEALGLKLALDTRITPELEREGLARDVVRHVQQLRKETGLDVSDRIELSWTSDDPQLSQAIEDWAPYIQKETLSVSINPQPATDSHQLEVGPAKAPLRLSIKKA